MTLIISLAMATKVLQASDRRLTRPDGILVDDNSNKAVCVGCKDGHFCIAYTGLALIEGTRTDEWVVDFLISIRAYQMNLVSITEVLEERLTKAFYSLPKQSKRMTFAVCGFSNITPFAMLISNFERDSVWPPAEAQDNFTTHLWWLKKRQVTENAYWLSINGTRQAVTRPILRRLKAFIRNGFFLKEGNDAVASKLVSIIREAAETKYFGDYIGRNCMATIVAPNPTEGFITKYYPSDSSSYNYAPHLITPPAIAVKRVQIWTGKGPPPWRKGRDRN
jgi:hypothetical protein